MNKILLNPTALFLVTLLFTIPPFQVHAADTDNVHAESHQEAANIHPNTHNSKTGTLTSQAQSEPEQKLSDKGVFSKVTFLTQQNKIRYPL